MSIRDIGNGPSQGDPMKAIERVMKAYRHCHPVTDEQAQQIRHELSTFIDELLLGKLPIPDDQPGPRSRPN